MAPHHRILYRALLKLAREADADPLFKQELVRLPNPLIQVLQNPNWEV